MKDIIPRGWWKNPDYERCWHLSISRKNIRRIEEDKLVKIIFGAHLKWTWLEPPYTEQGKRDQVYHYRLFCDPAWFPIKPRGEVYNTHFTEKGWKSYSDLNKL